MIDILGTPASSVAQATILHIFLTAVPTALLSLTDISESFDRISYPGSKIWLPHLAMPHLANPLGNEEIDFTKEQFSIWSNGKISHVKESKYSVRYSKFSFSTCKIHFLNA